MDSSAKSKTGDGVADALVPRLKGATHEIHATLESYIDLMNRVTTPADYKKLLEAFYGLFSPIEDRIERHKSELAAWIPDIESRMRTDSLRRDLHVLGNISPQDLPIATVPEYHSLAEQMGCLYVLEGSTLGGQVIARQIFQSLGFTLEHGCEFFCGHGTATGEMWQRFRNGIERYASSRPGEHTAVIESAVRTFQRFYLWMKHHL